MKTAALLSISAYQRYLSPYKGFCCAYGAYTGRQSCSHLGYRAIRRFGLVQGWHVLRGRFERCGEAHRRIQQRGVARTQRGICDIPCVGCDVPSCDLPCHLPDLDCKSACDALDCLNCSCCDWPDSGRKKSTKDQGQYVYLPPRNRSRSSTHE